MRAYDSRCDELLEKVFRKSQLVLKKLLKVREMVEAPEFEDLREELKAYDRYVLSDHEAHIIVLMWPIIPSLLRRILKTLVGMKR